MRSHDVDVGKVGPDLKDSLRFVPTSRSVYVSVVRFLQFSFRSDFNTVIFWITKILHPPRCTSAGWLRGGLGGAPSLSLSQSVPLSVTQDSKHARIGTSECVIFRAAPRVRFKRSGAFLLLAQRESAVSGRYSCVARSRRAIATLLCIHITGLVRRYMATIGWKFKSLE